MKIRKVDDKPMVLHTKEEPKLKLQKKKQTGKKKSGILIHKFPLKKAKERKEKSAESIKIRQQRIHAITSASAKTVSKELDGGEEIRESVELMAVTAEPVIRAGEKASKVYRRKKQQEKKDRERRNRRRQTFEEEVQFADMERRRSAIKAKKKSPTQKDRGKQSEDNGNGKGGFGGSKLAATKMMEAFLERFRLDDENEKTIIQSLAETAKANLK